MGKSALVIFELPQRLGILQYVEHESLPRELCSDDWCPHEGVLTAEGCRRGVCIKYRVQVSSRDGRRWEAKGRRGRDEEVEGCIRQQVADALWELAEKYDVGLWYEYRRADVWADQHDVFCGIVVNGIRLYQPLCRTTKDCVKQILEAYKKALEIMSEPPEPALAVVADPVEELLREWPELQTFGAEWVRKWLDIRERLVEIAKVLRRFPWMAEVMKQRPVSLLHPYMVEVYVARDGSEACLSLNPPKAFCGQNGVVRELKLELEFKRHETYEDKMREVYRPKGLLAFAVSAKEYVKML